jgi:hypothetical protein
VCAEAEQVGFARLVTDYAIFALLCDVFILDAHQLYRRYDPFQTLPNPDWWMARVAAE